MFNRGLFPPYLILGFAIFSMFFGAGNVIYPMDLGIHAGASVSAWFGFMLTAIGAPLLGLYAVMLSRGNLFRLFEQTGIKGASGWIMILIFALGPLGATPRCVILSYQAIKAIVPDLSMVLYSVLLGIVLFYICLKRTHAFILLGKALSPTLLVLLLTIAGLSFIGPGTSVVADGNILQGLVGGYQTMDLLSSLLFAVSIWHIIQHTGVKENLVHKVYLKAALIGASLLCFVYLCLGLAASGYVTQLSPMTKDLYLNNLSLIVLGELGGKIACAIIFLTCLTTIVALLIACTESTIIVGHQLKKSAKLPYKGVLAVMLMSTMVTANLGFETVSEFISVIVSITYPVYIVIAVFQILAMKFNLKRINTMVYATFALALVSYLYQHNILLSAA